MHPKDRQKMCTSCDGRIAIDEASCPYCGNEQAMAPGSVNHHQSLQDSLTALYPPPYSSKGNTSFSKPSERIQKTENLRDTMQEKRYNQATVSLGAPTIPVDLNEEQRVSEEKSSFWPVLFLSIGANLLVIGLLQLFFSDEGILRLEWNSHYWFVYCLAALPLFFLGYKKVNALQ